MKKIYTELARIQQELKAPKNLYNKFGKYNYRNAEGILESVKPLLNGYVLLINDEPVLIGERYYIKATATVTDGEESVSAVAYAREDDDKKGMDGCQITGACSSYARKYALNALLMIDDSKDSDDDSLSPKNPDNDNGSVPPANVRPNAPAGNVNVTTSGSVPNVPAPQTPPPTPALPHPDPMEGELPGAFIKRRISEIKANHPDFNFMEARAGLIEGGVIEDIPSATMNMAQAKALMDAIDKNFRKAG